jgi:hypothetical protein
MPFLLMYWKHLLAVALLATAGAWLYRAGGNAERVKCMAAQAKQEAAYRAQLEQAQSDAAKANEALRQRLAKPAPGNGIREVVRNVPSDCRVDPAVSDSVREAVKRANQAAAAK